MNAPAVVAWNSDKHYLDDLAAAGVPTLPSYFFEPGQKVRLPKGEVVVKPAIGAGSIDTRRFTDRAAARAHAAALQDSGRTALVQPYDARVEAGETALVFLGGEQSNAFTKGPMLPPEGKLPGLDESGTFAEESLTGADPDFAMWDVGYAALNAAAAHLGIARAELLYARVDLIGGPDAPLLLELELIEPSLGWRQLGEEARALQQRAFAVCVESALERLEQVRCRIDAHSAAVATVQAATPATCRATSAAGTPEKNWIAPSRPGRSPERRVQPGDA